MAHAQGFDDEKFRGHAKIIARDVARVFAGSGFSWIWSLAGVDMVRWDVHFDQLEVHGGAFLSRDFFR